MKKEGFNISFFKQLFFSNSVVKVVMSLREFLIDLRSCNSDYGVWVNPDNYDEYRIGQFIFENGGINDGFICIGSLEELCPYPSEREAFYDLFTSTGFLLPVYKNKRSKYKVPRLWELFCCMDKLDSNFQKFLEEQLEESIACEVNFRVDVFLETHLPKILGR